MLMLSAILSLTGCASSGTQIAETSETAGNERMASSLTEYAQVLLRDMGDSMSSQQRDSVARAAQSGSVSTSDYERAWSDFKACMMDLGYNTPVLLSYSNGMHEMALADQSGMDKSQRERFVSDYIVCHSANVLGLNTLYGVQTSNPSLYAHPYTGAIACLKSEELVETSYSNEDFIADNDAYRSGGKTIVDFENPETRSCLIGNGVTVNWRDAQQWVPLG